MIYALIVFVVLSALEIGLLLLSSDLIGIWPTVGMIILTGIVGGTLAKRQGAEALRLAQMQLRRGEIPSGAIMDGICIMAAAILLVTPGFITDTTGFLLLIPFTRGVIKIGLTKIIQKLISRGTIHYMKR